MKTSIIGIIKRAFLMYFKNFFLYTGVYFIVMLPAALISAFLLRESLSVMMFAFRLGIFSPSLRTAGIFILITVVLSFVTGVLTLGGCIHLADNTYEGRPLKFFDALLFAFKKAAVYLQLSLRVFWYVFSAVAVFVIIYMVFIAASNALLARGYIGSIDLTQLIILKVFDVLIIVIAVFRSLQAVFAFFILFDEKDISSREAFKKSLELTKGNLWRVIEYGVVISLIVSFISYAIWWIFTLILNAIPYGTIYFVFEFVFDLLQGGIVFPLTVIFLYLFYRGIRKEKGIPQKPIQPSIQAVL